MSSPLKDAEKHPPKLDDGSYDKDLVKKMFMDSPFIDWTRFAEANGWDAYFTRRQFPVQAWQKEKKAKVAENQADKLSALLFDKRYSWHADVLETIEAFPKFADGMRTLIQLRMSQMGEAYKEFDKLKKMLSAATDPKDIANLTKEVKNCEWNKYKNSDIASLATAVTQIGDFKYRTLMLKNWSIDKAMLDTDPAKVREIEESGGITFLAADGVELTTEGIQKLLDTYLDKPAEVIDVGKD